MPCTDTLLWYPSDFIRWLDCYIWKNMCEAHSFSSSVGFDGDLGLNRPLFFFSFFFLLSLNNFLVVAFGFDLHRWVCHTSSLYLVVQA